MVLAKLDIKIREKEIMISALGVETTTTGTPDLILGGPVWVPTNLCRNVFLLLTYCLRAPLLDFTPHFSFGNCKEMVNLHLRFFKL